MKCVIIIKTCKKLKKTNSLLSLIFKIGTRISFQRKLTNTTIIFIGFNIFHVSCRLCVICFLLNGNNRILIAIPELAEYFLFQIGNTIQNLNIF